MNIIKLIKDYLFGSEKEREDRLLIYVVDCDNCHALGTVVDESDMEHDCLYCNGLGVIKKELSEMTVDNWTSELEKSLKQSRIF